MNKNFLRGIVAIMAILLFSGCNTSPVKTKTSTVEKTEYLISQTPPMGWNSYNCFGGNVTEAEVKANADYMAQNLKQLVGNILW